MILIGWFPLLLFSRSIFIFSLDIAYQCGTCNECFEQPRALERHLNEKHFNQTNQPMDIILKCVVCCENFDKNEINQHLCISQEKITCEYCEKEFSSTARILKHLSAAHKNKEIYKCNRCQQYFGMNLLMVVHNRVSVIKVEKNPTLSSLFLLTSLHSVFISIFTFSLTTKKTRKERID